MKTATPTAPLWESICQAHKAGKLLDGTKENLEAWLQENFLPEWGLCAIESLVKQEAWDELNDRFYKTLAFGTGGMRGRTIAKVHTEAEMGTPSEQGTPEHAAIGSNVLNDFNIIRATMGLYRYADGFLKARGAHLEAPKLVIAHDVRHFSRHFCELAASTWTELGGKALIFEGPRSTPQLSFSVRAFQATAGVVVTASHNPPHDNGYKVYFEDGAQVVSPHAEGIIDEVNRIGLEEIPHFLDKKLEGVVVLPPEAEESYFNTVRESVIDAELMSKQAPSVVFSSIHGTGQVTSVPAMKAMGVDVTEVAEQASMDPNFPTVESPNPEYAEALSMGIKKAKEVNADLLLATDPDADRMGMAVKTSSGEMELFTGNQIGSVLAEYRISQYKAKGWIPQEGTQSAALVKTFVTSPLQDTIAKTHGLKVINTLTGFKWIGEKLKIYEETLKEALYDQEGLGLDYDWTTHRKRAELLMKHSTFFVFGGEESYGYLGTDSVRDKDANAAVLMICELAAYLKSEGLTFPEYLDQIYLKYGYFKEDLLSVYYEGAAGAQKIQNILTSYRENPPKDFDGVGVKNFTDFGVQEIKDDDARRIPSQDFYFIELENGYRYAVRGSGTEPKIKFYLFAHTPIQDANDLQSVKDQTQETLRALKTNIERDAQSRAEK